MRTDGGVSYNFFGVHPSPVRFRPNVFPSTRRMRVEFGVYSGAPRIPFLILDRRKIPCDQLAWQ